MGGGNAKQEVVCQTEETYSLLIKNLGEGSICELISICKQGSDYYKPGLEAASTGTVNIYQAFTVM